jgi:hypothetical protein
MVDAGETADTSTDETNDDAGAVPPVAGDGIRFVGMTPDARTLAWFENGALNYADRDDPSMRWNPGATLDAITATADRPALSPDGLRLVVVSADRHGFTEYARVDRAHRFDAASSDTQFARINALGLMLGSNEWQGSPVLSDDDRTLVYLRGEGSTARHDAIYVSHRTGDVAWPLGVPLHATELDAMCGFYRRPTGLSSDELTLFYWDEIGGSERAIFRTSPEAPFAGSVDLGDAPDAVPGRTCTTMYFSSRTGGGIQMAVLNP